MVKIRVALSSNWHWWTNGGVSMKSRQIGKVRIAKDSAELKIFDAGERGFFERMSSAIVFNVLEAESIFRLGDVSFQF